MRNNILFATLVLIAAGTLISAGAQAQITVTLHASLTAFHTMPPATSARAGGTADFQLDRTTHEIKWRVTYSGLSSAPTAVHIHAVAGPGVRSDIVLDLATNGLGNPLVGSATLDDMQIADLVSGKDYVDIHTKLNQEGEIRGAIGQ